MDTHFNKAILYMAWKKWSTARRDYNGELSVKSVMKISQFLVIISPVLGNNINYNQSVTLTRFIAQIIFNFIDSFYLSQFTDFFDTQLVQPNFRPESNHPVDTFYSFYMILMPVRTFLLEVISINICELAQNWLCLACG